MTNTNNDYISHTKTPVLILLTLLSHQWKSFWRSRSAGKSIAIQIIMGLVVLYFLSVAVGAGLFLREFIRDTFPAKDPARVFCSGIFYYFSFDILMRFMWQDLPTLTIQPYLIQNIRRSQLIRFLNIRSLFNVINLLPLVLAMPFIVGQIGPEYGNPVMIAIHRQYCFSDGVQPFPYFIYQAQDDTEQLVDGRLFLRCRPVRTWRLLSCFFSQPWLREGLHPISLRGRPWLCLVADRPRHGRFYQ